MLEIDLIKKIDKFESFFYRELRKFICNSFADKVLSMVVSN